MSVLLLILALSYIVTPATAQNREIRVVGTTVVSGRTVDLSVEIVAQGNENAIGFSLNFNPAILSNPVVTQGSGVAGATFNANTNQADIGRIGIALAMPASQTLGAGVRQIVRIVFVVAGSAPAGTTAITFVNQPVFCEVVDVNANPMATTLTPGSINVIGIFTSVSAASYGGSEIATESIVAAFGVNLANGSASANTIPLPLVLAGTKVMVKDSAGVERAAPLFFVSPGQVNYQMPQGTANGIATVTITTDDNKTSIGTTIVTNVAPGLFAANTNGRGVAGANILRVKQNGDRTYESIYRYDSSTNSYVSSPIDLGPEGEQVILILYGTGFRFRSSLSAVSVKIGGIDAVVMFAGATQEYVGLDQCNVLLPRSLAGRGEVDIVMTVDVKISNAVIMNIK